LSIEIPFYHRYVDDIALVAPRHKINEFLNTFNLLHPRLQFMLEIGCNILNFLDVTLINNKGKLEFDWYKKPTFSGHLISYPMTPPLKKEE